MQNKILDIKSYDDFKHALIDSACRKCELANHRTHIVVDRGNPNADVVMIGEGPGENEDLQGKAFVGRAGKLLDGMLGEFDFNTDEHSLIINVVKCRPPGNRAPKQEEVNACSPYLKTQLALVKPRFLLLLGATALKHLFPEKKNVSMKSQAGVFFEAHQFPGARIMVLYHPAYILRDPRKRPEMMTHLRVFVSAWRKA
ncbi:MAG: uracil-DNA glycosylase [Candidatus Omnitrophota bacterium]|nr:uracil-DNA glycosylase [Candidatus Omnitrophota bacterium]